MFIGNAISFFRKDMKINHFDTYLICQSEQSRGLVDIHL